MRCSRLRPSGARLVVFVALFLFGFAAEGAALTLTGRAATLHFDAQRGTVTRWQLREAADARERSRAPVDLAAPGHTLFRLEGEVAGRSISEWERDRKSVV